MTGLALVGLVLGSLAAGYGLHAHQTLAAQVRAMHGPRYLPAIPEQRKAS